MSTIQLTPALKRYRRDRATSTVAAFGAKMTVSTTVAMGFLVVPGALHFGVSTGQFLLYYSLFVLVSAVMFSVAGRIINRVGVRLVLWVSGLVSALAWVGMAFSPNIMVFYGLAVIMGMGAAGNNLLPANVLITGWHVHKRRGTVLGIVATGASFGGALIGVIFPVLMLSGGFVAGCLGIAAMIFVCSVLPGLFLAKNPPRAGEEYSSDGDSDGTSAPADRKAAIRGFGTIVVLLAIGCFLFSMESAFSSVQPAVYASVNIDITTAGLMLSFFSICGIISKPILGFLHDRLGIKALFAVLILLYVLGLPALAFAMQLGVSALWPLLAISALSLSVPGVIIPLVAVTSVGRDRFPVIYGMMLSGTFAGMAVAVPGWGAVYDFTGGFTAAMYGGAFLGLIGLLLVYIGMRRGIRVRKALDETFTSGMPVVEDEDEDELTLIK